MAPSVTRPRSMHSAVGRWGEGLTRRDVSSSSRPHIVRPTRHLFPPGKGLPRELHTWETQETTWPRSSPRATLVKRNRAHKDNFETASFRATPCEIRKPDRVQSNLAATNNDETCGPPESGTFVPSLRDAKSCPTLGGIESPGYGFHRPKFSGSPGV